MYESVGTYTVIGFTFLYNVRVGLINPSRLINHHCPPKKSNLKTGGPPGLINRLAWDD